MSLVVERIVILPVIAGIRDTAAVSIMSINTVTNAVSGVDLTSDDPIAVAALGAYQLQSSAQVETLTTSLAAKTTAYDAEVAKVTALTAEKTALTSEKATLESTIEELRSDIADLDTALDAEQQLTATLQAQIIELTPPPAPLSITRYQCTTWLRSVNILQPNQSVSDLVRMIVTDQDAQLRALDRWELGTSVLRNDPMIETLGQLLGLNSEALDAAFLVASQIQ
jgi:hypothetical protein